MECRLGSIEHHWEDLVSKKSALVLSSCSSALQVLSRLDWTWKWTVGRLLSVRVV